MDGVFQDYKDGSWEIYISEGKKKFPLNSQARNHKYT
jgi:hypothetical protein